MPEKKDRSTSNSILRVMLKEFPKEEIIENMIAIINVICNTEEDLKKVRHLIIIHAHARKVFHEKSKLEDYEEPHRTEVKEEVEKLEADMYRTGSW